MHRYREQNKEATKVYWRQWAEKNHDKQLAYHRHYREENREQRRTYDCQYYQEHRKERAACYRRWVKKNRKKRNAWRRDWDQKNPERRLARELRRKAYKARAVSTLTLKQMGFEKRIGEATYPGEELHLHHLVPLSSAGGHTWGNIIFIPASLNLSIGNKLPQEVYRQGKLL